MKPLPRTIYFEGGYIKFTRKNDQVKYTVWKWVDKSLLVSESSGIYTNQSKEEMLKLVA